MIPTSEIRKAVQTIGIFLAVAAFVSTNSAQTTEGTKLPAEIQGESIGVAANHPP